MWAQSCCPRETRSPGGGSRDTCQRTRFSSFCSLTSSPKLLPLRRTSKSHRPTTHPPSLHHIPGNNQVVQNSCPQSSTIAAYRGVVRHGQQQNLQVWHNSSYVSSLPRALPLGKSPAKQKATEIATAPLESTRTKFQPSGGIDLFYSALAAA